MKLLYVIVGMIGIVLLASFIVHAKEIPPGNELVKSPTQVSQQPLRFQGFVGPDGRYGSPNSQIGSPLIAKYTDSNGNTIYVNPDGTVSSGGQNGIRPPEFALPIGNIWTPPDSQGKAMYHKDKLYALLTVAAAHTLFQQLRKRCFPLSGFARLICSRACRQGRGRHLLILHF